MKLEKDDLEAIIVAVLAVNRYSLEKAYDLLPAFRKAGLLSPEKVAPLEIEDVITRLHAAGYQRGGLMGIMGGRFHSVMQAIHAGKLDTFSGLARKGSIEKATELLCSVKGIGPSVAVTVLELVKAGAKSMEGADGAWAARPDHSQSVSRAEPCVNEQFKNEQFHQDGKRRQW